MIDEIESAFAGRQRPDCVTKLPANDRDIDYVDTIWFSGRDWRELSREDWRAHQEAYAFLTPDAFAYFLPSILILSLRIPEEEFILVDRLEFDLATIRLDIDGEELARRRFGRLETRELETLLDWLAWRVESYASLSPEEYARARGAIERLLRFKRAKESPPGES
jgi:hypothetical protein